MDEVDDYLRGPLVPEKYAAEMLELIRQEVVFPIPFRGMRKTCSP